MQQTPHPRRITIENPHIWHHHQRGWKYVIHLLRRHLHAPDGILLLSSVDDVVAGGHLVKRPWVGFLHQVPDTHGRWFPDLKRIFATPTWQANLQFCRGLFVLSEYLRSFVIEHVTDIPVSTVYYPSPPAKVLFNPTEFKARHPRRMFHIGQYLRNYQAFYDLASPDYQKYLAWHHGVDTDDVTTNDSVTIVPSLSMTRYDKIFADSLLFLNLKDASATTVIVEAIAANTPLLINPVGGVREYLGEDYSLYYQNLEEAAAKAADSDLVLATSRYLACSRAKTLISKSHFLASLVNSEVYERLGE